MAIILIIIIIIIIIIIFFFKKKYHIIIAIIINVNWKIMLTELFKYYIKECSQLYIIVITS